VIPRDGCSMSGHADFFHSLLAWKELTLKDLLQYCAGSRTALRTRAPMLGHVAQACY